MGFNFNGDSFNSNNGSSVNLEDYIETDPTQGKYKVKNLYVDPDTGRLTVEYEDTPVEE